MTSVLSEEGATIKDGLGIPLNLDFGLKILLANDFGLKDLDLLETLGTGVFGRTRLVRTLKDRRFYSLKIMKKSRIVRLQQLGHALNELRILSRVRCTFVVNLVAFFQDENSIYFMTDFEAGGELYSHLRKAVRFDFARYQFYAIESVCAVEHLHQLSIIFRDVKPENILITKDGHVRLSEFTLAKISKANKTFTLCGTPEYLAPEVISGGGYGAAIDWWAVGVLLYEMAVGHSCFCGRNPFVVYKKIVEGRISFPTDIAVPKSTKSVIAALLAADPQSRLGSTAKGGFRSIISHSFFKGVDWNSAFQELMIPPVVPTVDSDGDTSNFDYYLDEASDEPSNLTKGEREMFLTFERIIDR